MCFTIEKDRSALAVAIVIARQNSVTNLEESMYVFLSANHGAVSIVQLVSCYVLALVLVLPNESGVLSSP